jgi:hypothetical protein
MAEIRAAIGQGRLDAYASQFYANLEEAAPA